MLQCQRRELYPGGAWCLGDRDGKLARDGNSLDCGYSPAGCSRADPFPYCWFWLLAAAAAVAAAAAAAWPLARAPCGPTDPALS